MCEHAFWLRIISELSDGIYDSLLCISGGTLQIVLCTLMRHGL